MGGVTKETTEKINASDGKEVTEVTTTKTTADPSKTTPIDPKTKYKQDRSLDPGKTRVVHDGTSGSKTTTTETTTTDTKYEVPITVYVKDKTETVSDEKSIKRDIYTQIEGEEKKKIDTQNVTLTRTGVKNLTTQQTTWGQWSTGKIDAYTAPEIKNYDVQNPDAAPRLSVNSNTKDSEVVFEYKAKHDVSTQKCIVSRKVIAKNRISGGTIDVAYQNAIITRSVDKNLVTGETTYGKWSSATLPAVEAPEFDGFTVYSTDVAKSVDIDGSILNHTSGDHVQLDPVVFDYNANDQHYSVSFNLLENSYWFGTHIVNGRTYETLKSCIQENTPDECEIFPNQDIPAELTLGPETSYLVVYVIRIGKNAADDPAVVKETYKVVFRNVYEQYPGGDQRLIDRESVVLTRTKNADGTFGQWSTGKLDATKPKPVQGYTVTNPKAASAITVDGSQNQLQDVVFTIKPNEQEAHVNYVDDSTNETTKSITVKGVSFGTTNFDAQKDLPEGYEIDDGQEIPTTFSFGVSSINATIYVHHKQSDSAQESAEHEKVEVKDLHPVQLTSFAKKENKNSLPFTVKTREKDVDVGSKLDDIKASDFINVPAGAKANIVWDDPDANTSKAGTLTGKIVITMPSQTTYRTTITIQPAKDKIVAWNDGTVHKNVTRTIHYRGAGDQTPDDDVEIVSLSNTATFDGKGGFTWTDWTSNGSFNRVKTPEITGYTPDKDVVEAYTPTGSDSNFTVLVTYTKDSEPNIPGTTPDIPKTPEDHPKDDKPKEPKKPTEPVKKSYKSKQNRQRVINKQTITNSKISKMSQSTNPAQKRAQATLPQTGSHDSLAYAALGGLAALIGLSSLLYLDKKQKN